MKFASALSTRSDAEDAVNEVIDHLQADGPAFDMAIVFYTAHHSGEADSIAQTLIDRTGVSSLMGCSCEGVIAGATEVEGSPGLSVLTARLPGVRIQPFHISKEQWRDAMADRDGFNDYLGIHDNTRVVLAAGDPWTTPINQVLRRFDDLAPQVPILGGMASGASEAGENVLLFNDARFDQGMVGLSLSGAIHVESVVSQGCRPIGRCFVVTKGHDNVIEQLGGKPALTALEEMVHALPDQEKRMLSSGLLIGQAMTEYKESFARGDFAVRSIIGVNDEDKALGVGDRVQVGQTIQFHVRDAATADEDLNQLLATRQTQTPAGAILFSCNGRGTRLFDKPNHDARVASTLMQGVPMAGFFAAGELGPVGGRNFIHGHTASFALFSPEA